MARIGVITNPYSGLNKNGEVDMAALDDLVRGRGFHIIAKDDSEIQFAIDEVRQGSIDILALNSGDGGNHKLITELMCSCRDDEMPLVVTLRGGTINVVASALGFHDYGIIRRHVLLRSPPEQILDRVVREYSHLPPEHLPFVERKVLHVSTTDKDGGDINLYGFMFANGIVTTFIKEYYSSRNMIATPGKAKFFEVLIKALGSVPARYISDIADEHYRNMTGRQPLRAKLDGETLPMTEVIGMAAASMDLSIDLGPLSLRPFYGINGTSRIFQVIGGNMPIPEIITNLPNLFAGRPIQAEEYFDRKVQSVELTADDQDFILDGDIYSSTGTIAIDAARKLRFLAKKTPYY